MMSYRAGKTVSKYLVTARLPETETIPKIDEEFALPHLNGPCDHSQCGCCSMIRKVSHIQ